MSKTTDHVIDKINRVEEHYDELRYYFERRLIEECDYQPRIAENSNDWRDEYVDREWKTSQEWKKLYEDAFGAKQ